ncbi:thiamine phosphate synthase [Lysobacter sp. GX 14042]|uniref:thiamine phosphate synthase n=1 Tax=Lysobacter sp. GX 14042 TaxID=2907155 RepID=UPI001F4049AC|nr:thiamine phosphate synthase [Lysobacter sp. GX 14042]MCE7033539.1 thiamine phosphate synthase [Lysobacter sp. GX 14042]
MDPEHSAPRPRGLYLITPDEGDTGRLLARLEPLLALHPCWLQYRNKPAGPALRRRQASALVEACARHRVPLLVNDDWRLALEVGAAGAHLGEGDGALEEARAAMGPDALLGASCYDDPGRARRALAAGADHVAFGAFFPSSTKPAARRATPALLRQAAALPAPVVAIGGITPDNGRGLVEAGADLLAVIAGVFDAPDPVAAARAYQACFDPPP